MKYTVEKRLQMLLLSILGEMRDTEYEVALAHVGGATSLLDVGCGTGTFLDFIAKRCAGIKPKGVDFNPDCVEVCLSKGLDAKCGDALDLPYPDGSFDFVYCSHVLQVFKPSEARRCITELVRVTKPGGLIAIATIPQCKRLFFEIADMRPYPPQAIRTLMSVPKLYGNTAPTLTAVSGIVERDIWFRRPPLIEFIGSRSRKAQALASLLNRLQYVCFLRKYWALNGYIMFLEAKDISAPD